MGMRPPIVHELSAQILLGASLAIWVGVEVALRWRSRSRGRTVREWTFFFVLLACAASATAAVVAAVHPLAPLPGADPWPVVVGLALLWAGIAFRWWAIITLGRFFKLTVVIQDQHRVVDHGPYRRVRHPSYLGFLVASAGLGVALGDWVSLGALLVGGMIACVVRIRVEERVLLGALGEEYATYAGRTARLVPGLF